jgi:hypothetical protein
MNILVKLTNGNVINPNFEPTPLNLVNVKAFYVDLFEKHEIEAFTITYDNGDTFGMTHNV